MKARSLLWLVLWPAVLLFHVAWWAGKLLHHRREAREQLESLRRERSRLEQERDYWHWRHEAVVAQRDEAVERLANYEEVS